MKDIINPARWAEKRIVAGLVLAIASMSAFAEPSGRGAEIEVMTTLHEDLFFLIFGTVLLVVGGGLYLLRDKHKLLKITSGILIIIGGIAAFASGWVLLSKFVLYPIFYVLSYGIKVLLYVAVVLLPFAITYWLGRKISNIYLRVAIYIILGVLIILGEYYIIVELEAYRWFPEWNFTETFYNTLNPIEE